MQKPLFYEEDIPKVQAKKRPIQKKEETEKEKKPEPKQEKTEKISTLEQVLAQMDTENTAEIQPEPTIDLEEELEQRAPETEQDGVEGLPTREKWQEGHTEPLASMQKALSKIYKRRSAGTTDCRHRRGNTCFKTGKRIALDCRQLHDRRSQNTIACWERMHCDAYEKKEVQKHE